MTFELCVFNEFAAKEALDKAASAIEGLKVDVAPEPNPLVKEDVEKHAVATNAKLFFPEETAAEDVDAACKKLIDIGFTVVKRNPITSAGAPMLDRVILRFGPEFTA